MLAASPFGLDPAALAALVLFVWAAAIAVLYTAVRGRGRRK